MRIYIYLEDTIIGKELHEKKIHLKNMQIMWKVKGPTENAELRNT